MAVLNKVKNEAEGTTMVDQGATLSLDPMSALLAYWDRNLVCRFANAAYFEWYGLKHEQLVNKMTIRQLLGEPMYQLNLPYITEALSGRDQTFERMIPLQNGMVKCTTANYYTHVVNGDVRGFYVHVTDTSRQKQLENELIRANELLNIQNKSLVNFANKVAHDLRSYSGNLAATLELMQHAEDEMEQQVFRGLLKDISTRFTAAVANLNEIVAAHNKAVVSFEHVVLAEYVDKAIQTVGLQVITSGATITNRIDPAIVLSVNRSYLESILLNLLTNALKYRHPTRPPVVEVDAFPASGRKVIVTVKDNGTGIDLERFGKDVFGMYKTFHGNPDAMGIGLYITRFQVEAMGGAIELESTVGVGTTFIISFNS